MVHTLPTMPSRTQSNRAAMLCLHDPHFGSALRYFHIASYSRCHRIKHSCEVQYCDKTKEYERTTMFRLLRNLTPPSMPRRTEMIAKPMIRTMIDCCRKMLLSKPNTWLIPLAACVPPKPNEVARPNRVTNTVSTSITSPVLPHTAHPKLGRTQSA